MPGQSRPLGEVGLVRARGIAVVAAGLMATAAPAQDGAEEERLVLPSGLEAQLQEVLLQQSGEGGLLLRARYVAEALAPGAPLEEVSADLEHLCNADALPRIAEEAREGARIIVSLGDGPSEFGVPSPDVRQVFEAFTVQGGLCIWEAF